jgi:hypothetical protein
MKVTFGICVPYFGKWRSSHKQWVRAGENFSQTIRALSPIDFGEKENFHTGDGTVAAQCVSIRLQNYHSSRYSIQHGEQFWKKLWGIFESCNFVLILIHWILLWVISAVSQPMSKELGLKKQLALITCIHWYL